MRVLFRHTDAQRSGRAPGARAAVLALADVNQTCVFFSFGWSPVLKRFLLSFGVKELGREIKVKIRDAATGFFPLAAGLPGRPEMSGSFGIHSAW